MARREPEDRAEPIVSDDPAASAPPAAGAGEGAQPSSLLVNSGAMLAARAYGIAITGALAIFAIRTLSIEEYGRYSVALALVTIFLLFSDMGIAGLTLREMTQRPEREQHTLGVALGAEAVTSIVAVALLVPVGLALGYPSAILVLLAIGAATVVFQGFLAPIETAFRARRVFEGAFVPGLQSTVTAVVGFWLVSSGAGAAGLMLAMLAGPVAAVPAGLWLLRRRLRLRPALRGVGRAILPFLRSASPIALAGAVWAVYERIDVLMLSKLAGLEAVALYNVPLMIVQYLLLVPAIVGTTFFPLLSRALKDDPPSARDPLFLMARLFVFFSVPLAVALVTGGGDLLTLVFGARYAGSALPIAILSATVVLGFLNFLGWYALLGAHRERGMVVAIIVGLALNVALNLALIPAYGPAGAAVALVLSEIFVLACEAMLIRRHLFPLPIGRLLGKPALASMVVAPGAVLAAPISGLVVAPACAIIYAATLFALGYIGREEWEPITGPLRGGLNRVRARRGRSSASRS